MNAKIFWSACRVTLIYAVLGYLWILFSDRLLDLWVQDAALLSQLQTYKGWFYVAVTGVFLFFLVSNALQRIEAINQLDPLTGLFRHYQFQYYLDEFLNRQLADRHSLLLVYLDIDNFKRLNKVVGYDRADHFLADFSEALRGHYSANHVLGRLGSNQFAIAAAVGKGQESREEVLASIHRLFQRSAGMLGIDISYSTGVALAPDDGGSGKDLMAAATAALNHAKSQGLGELRYYNPDLSRKEDERQMLVADLKTAIRDEQLTLVYQPQFSLVDDSLTGVEVLVRWKHPRRGFIGPDIFIPLAEEFHLISQISYFVINKANRELAESGLLGNPIKRVSVNISAVEFNNEGLMESLFDFIQQSTIIHPYLQLEITETAALVDLTASRNMLSNLEKRGIKFSIDDFGTGFSSLALLKDLPISEIKIDRSFVNDMIDQPKAASIVEAIVHMAKSFGITVVAEGVETEQQLLALKNCHCHEAQGYLLAVPMSIKQLKIKLADYRQFSLVSNNKRQR